tara:strand:+ start:68 stop:361 length:294 start_codon:yes stop_codon:yes gene_type:complete
MPIVSINLSQPAYDAYKALEKGSRSRRVSYLLQRNYGFNDQQTWDNCPRCRGVMNPMVEVGDFRVMTNGDRVVWTLRGWELAGAEKCMEENFGVEEE